jgi:hypothetical protein
MDTKDKSDPEHDSAPTDATQKAPRTDIRDLPAPAGELTEEEAEQVAGGLVYVTPQNVTTLPLPLLVPDTRTSSRAFTTGGNPYPDQDTVYDQG